MGFVHFTVDEVNKRRITEGKGMELIKRNILTLFGSDNWVRGVNEDIIFIPKSVKRPKRRKTVRGVNIYAYIV